MITDLGMRQSEKLRAKLLFMKANEDLMGKKNERKARFLTEKNAEIEVHFPYNHGDAIEN
jgi:hypothetical protein